MPSTEQEHVVVGTPLGLRARPDLRATLQNVGGERRWAIKDPVSLRYFHLGEAEMFLFRLLKQPRSCQELKERFEGAYSPQRISLEQLHAFCARLHAHHLLVADGGGQATVLRKRCDDQRHHSTLNALFSVLAIRLPGIQPAALLVRLAWLGRMLFSRTCALAACLALFVAALLWLGRAAEFVEELPTLAALAQPHVVAYMILIMIMVKLAHELAHALACQRFGGECHEMGVLLLAFTPCLYCDVSDSWMFPSRWQRIVVALAGIYVELVIATLALLVWYFSEPGLLHTLAIYVVITCTISTVLVNGNPLLRYDGYYVLSDLVGIPNLEEQSRRALWEPLGRWILRQDGPAEPFDGPRAWLACYAGAAAVYQVVVLATVLWFLHHVLAENQLRPVGDLLVALVLCGIAIHTARRGLRSFAHVPAWRIGGVLARGGLFAVFCVVALWGTLSTTFEQRVEAEFQLEAAGVVPVFNPRSGQVVQGVRYGERVRRGEPLVLLRDQGLQLELESINGRVQEVSTLLATMTIRAQQYPALFAEVATTRTVQSDLRRQQATLIDESKRLSIPAPVEGIVLRPCARYDGPRTDSIELHAWRGAPLDEPGRGCYLEQGALICYVGDPHTLQAIAELPAQDVGQIAIGDSVRLRFNQNPGETICGQVIELGLSDLRTPGLKPMPKHTAAERPREFSDEFTPARYTVRIDLENPPTWVRHGSGGVARIVAGSETIAQRIQRFGQRMFRFHL